MALLVILFIVVPIVELYVIIQIGGRSALADAGPAARRRPARLLLLRHQGRGAWQRFNEAIAERRFPGKEVADGLLIAIGGTLLLAPGFLTDIVGALFLIPPTRALVRRLLKRGRPPLPRHGRPGGRRLRGRERRQPRLRVRRRGDGG